ncbi:hypothetical protein FWH30_00280 [Microgenomates group bacterium]|nr:hypothetical protein [Microgenomates group bacterium]
MSQKLFAGIDAGGTTTRCFVIDASGHFLAFSKGGSGSIIAQGAAAIVNLQSTLIAAAAKINQEPNYEAIFIGASGINSPKEQKIAEQLITHNFDAVKFQKLEIQSDTSALHAAAFFGGSGVVFVCGTGSKCYGRTADNKEAVAGGLDWVLTDEGSGYHLGLLALKRIIRGIDGRDSDAAALRELIFTHLKIKEYGDLSAWLHSDRQEKTKIAALAPLVAQAALGGDVIAQQIFYQALRAGVELIVAVVNKLQLPTADIKLGITGSVITREPAAHIFPECLRERLPSATTFIPTIPPAAGAALCALQLAGITLTPDIIANIQNSALDQLDC